jgi:hypothetical protein
MKRTIHFQEIYSPVNVNGASHQLAENCSCSYTKKKKERKKHTESKKQTNNITDITWLIDCFDKSLYL